LLDIDFKVTDEFFDFKDNDFPFIQSMCYVYSATTDEEADKIRTILKMKDRIQILKKVLIIEFLIIFILIVLLR